jgi:acyl-coenzyme A thioesterase PaaI-like protein
MHAFLSAGPTMHRRLLSVAAAARLAPRRRLCGFASLPPIDETAFAQPVTRVNFLDPSDPHTWLDAAQPGYASRQFLLANPHLRVAYFRARARDELGHRLLARVWFGAGAAGPPGHAHGGAQAAVLDEAMGGCAWMNGHRVLAGEIGVRFERPLPLGTDMAVSARIEAVRGRKVSVRGLIQSCDGGVTYACGHGTFLRMRSLPHETERSSETGAPGPSASHSHVAPRTDAL